MLNKFIYLLFISFLSIFINSAAKEKHTDIITQSFNAVKGGKLLAKINQGDIYIKTWDKDEVLIKVDGIDEDELEALNFRKSGNTIIVDYKEQWGWGANADYYFTIPSKFNLEIYTTSGDIDIKNNIEGNADLKTMGGDIDILSVDGDLNVETMGGDISMNNATGKTNISTQGGDIIAENLSGSVQAVKTMGGDINIHFLNNVKEIVTYGGDIYIDECRGDIEAATFGGDIAIGKVTGSVKAKTYGGDIEITGANGFIDVNTGGGDIELKDITGAVDAKTAAGYIYLELTPSGSRVSEIKTSAGDIQLIIPAKANTTINAKVNAYRSSGYKSDSILSDFDGEVSKSRSKITGIYIINGGNKSSIRIEANSGTITINKK